MHVCVVGSGFSGAVVARELAGRGHRITLIDERSHLAGNCHTERDPVSGIMLHVYGPHIFHTDSQEVWDYVSRFAEMMPYVNRVRANVGGEIYQLPINLHTINQFFGAEFGPREAEAHIASLARKDLTEPANFEEQALSMVGEELYRAFFRGYTMKQWGVDPTELPASILKRLPLRFTSDDNYYNHRLQGIPKDGYTSLVSNMLASDHIELRLDCAYEDWGGDADHVVYSGPIDRYFGHALGRLGYRTLDFERIDQEGDCQGNAVVNYCDADVPFTRITEHKYFAPWEAASFDRSVCFREYARACGADDIPFYPLRLVKEKAMLADYCERASAETGVTFMGRLGTYAYIDMDVAIARALETAEALATALSRNETPPVFVHPPL